MQNSVATDAMQHVNTIRAQIAAGDTAAAEAAIDAVLAERPEAVDVLLLKAEVAAIQGRLLDAAQAAATAVAIDPDNVVSTQTLADLFLRLGHLDEAAMFQHHALTLEPDNAGGYGKLASIFRQMGKQDVTTELLEAGRAVEPGNVGLLVDLIDSYMATGALAKAVAVGRDARRLAPDDMRVLRNLGNALNASGDTAAAEEVFAHLAKVHPEDGYARHVLSSLRGETPQTAEIDYVREVFDGSAEKFEEMLIGRLRYRVPGLMFRRVEEIAGNRLLRILDLGCGTGLCGLVLREFASYIKGVDISSKMVEQAQRKSVYDALEVAEIVESLSRDTEDYDVVVAGDVLVYFGDLGPVLKAVHHRLVPGGLFIFSTEKETAGDSTVLDRSGRFRHAAAAVKGLAESAGFIVDRMDDEALRLQLGRVVPGTVWVLRKPAN